MLLGAGPREAGAGVLGIVRILGVIRSNMNGSEDLISRKQANSFLGSALPQSSWGYIWDKVEVIS